MNCTAHPGTTAVGSCSVCKKAGCDLCLAFEVDGDVACESCGALEDDRSRDLGSAMLALVGVGYLATLAVGFVVFRARPFVGGLAAVVAIALGRALQMYIRPRTVTRRPSAPRTG